MPDALFSPSLGFLGSLGWPEMLVLALLGVLIFGKRLPEVGKSLGRGIVEFKKGLSGIEDGLDEATKPSPRIDQQQANAGTDTTGGEKTSAGGNAHGST